MFSFKFWFSLLKCCVWGYKRKREDRQRTYFQNTGVQQAINNIKNKDTELLYNSKCLQGSLGIRSGIDALLSNKLVIKPNDIEASNERVKVEVWMKNEETFSDGTWNKGDELVFLFPINLVQFRKLENFWRHKSKRKFWKFSKIEIPRNLNQKSNHWRWCICCRAWRREFPPPTEKSRITIRRYN